MKRTGSSVMAVCLNERVSLYLNLFINLILCGFYYAFGGIEAMKFSVFAFGFALCSELIGSCSFPFGIAAFVNEAKNRMDYKNVLYVRMAGGLLTALTGVILPIILIAAGYPLSKLILGSSAPPADVQILYIIMILIGIYGLISTGLKWLRGFYQGMNEETVDRMSQRIFTVAFWVSSFLIMIILVHGFHLNRTYSVYGMCGGLITGKLLSLGYYMLFDRMKYKRYRSLAKSQMMPARPKKKVFKDLVNFTMPSLKIAVIASLSILALSLCGFRIAEMHSMKYTEASELIAVCGYMIPSLSILPVLFGVRAFDENIGEIAAKANDREKTGAAIEKTLIRYLSLALPVSFVFGCLAPQFVQLFFGSSLDVDAVNILRIFSGESVLLGMSVLLIQLMIVMDLGRQSVSYGFISLLVRIALLFALPLRFKVNGMLYASLGAEFVYLFLCLAKIANRLDSDYGKTAVMTFRILLACLAGNGVFALVKLAGFDGMSGDRLFDGAVIAAMIAIAFWAYSFILTLSGIHLFGDQKRKKEKQ